MMGVAHARHSSCGPCPPPGDLTKRDDETWAQYDKRLTKEQKAELNEKLAVKAMMRVG